MDPDRELVERAKGGDYDAFRGLVERHQGRIFAVARRITGGTQDAEDVVQETFLSVVEHLGEFRGESPFAAWLLRIATNHALKALRKRRGLPTVPMDEALPRPETVENWRDEPGRLADDPAVRKLLEEAIDELDDLPRPVVVLRDVEGLSTEATAEALGISVANVKVRLLRARLKLRERLTKALGDGRPVTRGPRADHGDER
jgi:RNA polymerase sigma-70 factor (ECF subfamily)